MAKRANCESLHCTVFFVLNKHLW